MVNKYLHCNIKAPQLIIPLRLYCSVNGLMFKLYIFQCCVKSLDKYFNVQFDHYNCIPWCLIKSFFHNCHFILVSSQIMSPCILVSSQIMSPCILVSSQIMSSCILVSSQIMSPCILVSSEIMYPCILVSSQIMPPCILVYAIKPCFPSKNWFVTCWAVTSYSRD